MNSQEMCLSHSIRRADRVISRHYNEALAPLGIKITQFAVLRSLDKLGETTATELQSDLVLEQATVSRALKPMIRDGLVKVRAGQDKRQKYLALSIAGRALLTQALPHWKAAQQSFRQYLGEGNERELVELNRQIVKFRTRQRKQDAPPEFSLENAFSD